MSNAEPNPASCSSDTPAHIDHSQNTSPLTTSSTLLTEQLAALQQRLAEAQHTIQQLTDQVRTLEPTHAAETQDAALSRQLPQDLEAQPALFDAVLDQLPLGISISEAPSGRGIYHNQQAERLLGHPLIAGDGIERFLQYHAVHADGRPYRPEEYPTARALLAGESVHDEEIYYRCGGEAGIKLFSVSATRVVDANGRPIAVVSTFHDISDRKRAEERFRSVLENSLDVAYRRNLLTDSYDYMSPVVEQVMGFTPAEMYRMPLGEILQRIHPDDRAHIETQMRLAEQTGQAKVEYRFCCKDGHWVWLADHMHVLKDARGRPLYRGGMVRDISDRKQAEANLADFTAKLERSNQELLEFAFVASHDLQEPLRKVRAFGSLLQDSLGSRLTGEERRHFERIENAAARMQEMIDALLELSRINTQGGSFQAVDLHALAGQVVSDLEVRLAREGGRVEIGALPVVHADPTQMQRLLLNLIGNALKYHRPDMPPLVRVWGETEQAGGESRVRIYIEDNGVGFEIQQLERVFQPFQRLHARSRYEGTGMGLPICRKIAERHGGSITAYSQPGEGSTFIVSLPIKNRHRA